MIEVKRSPLMRYGVAVLSVVIAAALEWLLWPIIKDSRAPLFFAAVMFSAWYGGRGPGLLSTVLSSIALDFFLAEPLFTPSLSSASLVRVAIFVVASLLISWLTTTRNRAEIELEESEKKFRQIAENIREVFWVSDPKARKTIYVSPAYEEIWGRTRCSLYEEPESLINSIHPDDRERIISSMYRQARGEDTDEQYRIVRADGQVCHIRDRGFPIRDASGDVYRVTGIAENVTERVRLLSKEQEARRVAEETAHRLERLQSVTAALSGALTASQVAEVIVDQGIAAFGASAGSVAMLNAPARQIEIVKVIGYDSETVEKWKTFSFDASTPIGDAIIKGEAVYLQSDADRVTNYPALAQHRPTIGEGSAAAIPLIVDDRVIGALGLNFKEKRSFKANDRAFMRALAQQCAQALERARLYENERAARKDAEVANRAKDEFLAIVSHELRTPLNAILGWAGMLRRGKLDQETYARAIGVVERNAKAQAQLIEDILDVSRIISGKFRLRVGQVDLAAVVAAAIDAVRPAADAKGIRLDTDIEAGAGLSGDPDRLQQVVWNLLSNAVKFTPDEGRIEVRVTRENSHARVVVKDTGQGINPEFLPYVFDRFLQADGSYTRRHGGLGLGLALVRHLVEMHGGNVKAESEGEGLGAVFTVTLPLRRTGSLKANGSGNAGLSEPPGGPAQRPEGAGKESYALHGLRAVVVDDDYESREMLKVMLEHHGVDVRTFGSAGEALELLRQDNSGGPDVLVSDIAMPEQDGYSFIRDVRALDGGRALPAIALTAHVRAEDRTRALASGYQVFVPKPVEAAELLSAIASLTGREGS
ncbi:MAG TPA: ATP-binding protein [Blastocatellia bacterium]|nr:ATP-binding protein [Blastocatellia bacterium]